MMCLKRGAFVEEKMFSSRHWTIFIDRAVNKRVERNHNAV